MSIFGKNKIDFSNLTNTEKVVYRYLQNHIDDLPGMRVRDVAAAAYVGNSSVLRLIHKLGYNSFSEFINDIRIQKSLDKGTDINKELQTSIQAFSDETLNLLKDIADKIVATDNLIFLGIGSSGKICDYGTWRFAGMGINSFAASDFTYPLATRLYNNSDALIIVLSISGNTPEVVETINKIHNRSDIEIVLLTPSFGSPLEELSDITIRYQEEEKRIAYRSDMSSQVPVVYLLEKLSELVYNQLN